MSQAKKFNDEDTMRPEYNIDYSKAIRGKTAARLAKMGYPTMVMLRPEVAAVFKDEASVNEALLKVIEMGKFTQSKPAAKPHKPAKTSAKKPRASVTQNG